MKKIVSPLLILFLLFGTAPFLFTSCQFEPLEGEFGTADDDDIDDDDDDDDDDDEEEDPDYGDLVLLRRISVNEAHISYSLNFFYRTDRQIERITYNNGLVENYVYNEGDVFRIIYFGNNAPEGAYKEYTYEDGVISERRDYINNDVLNERFVYHYNPNGTVAEIDFYGADDIFFSEKDVFAYDENGNCIARRTEYTDVSFNNIQTSFNYDANPNPFSDFSPNIVLIDGFSSFVNNPVSEVTFIITNNETLSVKNHEYTYGENGFPLSRVTTNEDGEVVQTTTYEYF